MKYLRVCNSKLRQLQPEKRTLNRMAKKDQCFFANIHVFIEKEAHRFFPSRIENNLNRLYYLYGKQDVLVSEVGYKFILDNNIKVLKVNKLYGYDEDVYTYPFKSFVDYFYTLKQDARYKPFSKLLLNSLYGKFGEKDIKELYVVNPTSDDWAMFRKGKTFCVGVFEEPIPFYKTPYQRYDLAGKITETARLYMGSVINKLRGLGNTVLYTDTDSIICTKPMPSDMVNESTLGLFKDEIGYKDDVILLGQKTYCFKKSGKSASKGMNELEYSDYEDIMEALIAGESITYNTKRFTKKGSLLSHDFFGIIEKPFKITDIRQRSDVI